MEPPRRLVEITFQSCRLRGEFHFDPVREITIRQGGQTDCESNDTLLLNIVLLRLVFLLRKQPASINKRSAKKQDIPVVAFLPARSNPENLEYTAKRLQCAFEIQPRDGIARSNKHFQGLDNVVAIMRMDTISQRIGRGRRLLMEAEQTIKFRRPIPAIVGMHEGLFVDERPQRPTPHLVCKKP
uniref:Uncharacterized protein n=1 Tax=Rhizobium leguminosarum TaxID=384 RepID=A0A154INV7_RHILE|nr:hypothetical protein A4A59_12325 [Rhizobium leguminosarum]